ncbi:MAG: HAMP domain-containing sensor histidine kinase [Acutalibacteraceae bacterium]|nr:HAMP domain-containing sensor histidine kinase [Acutalibacteraceae bacterium]
MVNKRLKLVIATVFILVYLLTTILLFSAVRLNTENLFLQKIEDRKMILREYNNGKQSVAHADSLIYMLQSDFEDNSVISIAVTDEKGNIISKSGSILKFSDGNIINIEKYLSEEAKNDINKFIKESGRWFVEEFTYKESDQKKIPVKLALCDRVDGERLVVYLSGEKANKIYKNNKNYDGIVATFFDINEKSELIKPYKKTEKRLMSSIKGNKDNYRLLIGDNECYVYFEGGGNLSYCTLISNEFIILLVVETFLFLFVCVILLLVLRYFNKKNIELYSAKLSFIKASSHELKTPLAIIDNRCELILGNISPLKKTEYVNSIYKESRYMNNLVSKLLQYSNIASKTDIIKKTNDLIKIIGRELEKYKEFAEIKDLELITDIPEKVLLGCDAELLGLVVDNFLSNAIKYTPEGNRVIVSIKQSKKSIRFSVFNEGGRLETDDPWNVFAEKGEKTSNGVGLAISKEILSLHGFKYGFNSTEIGVEFYFESK